MTPALLALIALPILGAGGAAASADYVKGRGRPGRVQQPSDTGSPAAGLATGLGLALLIYAAAWALLEAVIG